MIGTSRKSPLRAGLSATAGSTYTLGMRSVIATLLLMLLTCAGCASRPAASALDPVGTPPEDFSIDLTILAEAHPGDNLPATIYARPSRFVLFPDGSLHFGVDEESRGAGWLPGLTRRLNRDQMSRLWTLTRNLGLADAQRAAEPVNFRLIESQPGEVRYLAAIAAHNQRWAFIDHKPLEGDADPAMIALIDALAALAWADDGTLGAPQHSTRYDFGPDPYARYRR